MIDDDLALVLYTSGTTGLPKGVMLTHRTVCNNAWAIGSYLGNRPEDVVLCTLPLSFSYGLFQVLTAVEVGHAVVLERSLAYPADTLRRMRELGVTGLPGVPTTFAKLLPQLERREVELPALRYATNAGAALPDAHLARLRELLPGVRIFCMYGQTECTRASYLDPELLDEKPGSVGRAMPNCELYLVDDEGRRLPPGSTGELVVRGANVMRGYWGRRGETAARLRDGQWVGEKVLHTGDLFHMDDDGYLTFVGRRDDVFKSSGQKVSPLEVESAIYELPEVAEVVVVGAPDPIEGLAVTAYVVRAPGGELTESGVRGHCRAGRASPCAQTGHVRRWTPEDRLGQGRQEGGERAMCGVAGVFVGGAAVGPSLDELRLMLAAIRHRGPDGVGFYVDDHVGLANARLSLVGLQDGFQPLHNEERSVGSPPTARCSITGSFAGSSRCRGTGSPPAATARRSCTRGRSGATTPSRASTGSSRSRSGTAGPRSSSSHATGSGSCPCTTRRFGRRRLRVGGSKSLFAGGRVQPAFDPAALVQLFTTWSVVPPDSVFAAVPDRRAGHGASDRRATCAEGEALLVDRLRGRRPGSGSAGRRP